MITWISIDKQVSKVLFFIAIGPTYDMLNEINIEEIN